MSRAIIDYNTATASQKFEKLKEYLEKYETMASILKSKGLAKDNLDVNVGTMSRHNQRRFNHALYEVASNATTELNRLKDELANAHDDVDIERIVQKIDEQLARLNSTNRTLQRLRRKVGNIEPHQRSIQMKSVDIARLRNQKVADELYESPYISEKLGNLTAAYERERNASTASELYQAKKEVKKAEREIYGKRLTKRRARKIDKQFEKRKAVIARAQSVQVENNHEYRKEFRKAMKQLKKIDKKIIGKSNATEMYWSRNGLRRKSGYLVGGTSITLPKQVVDLENTIKAATR